MELTSEPNSMREPSIWPFIRKIKFVFYSEPPPKSLSYLTNDDRVYLKAYILSKGLILVDLPGEQDTQCRVFFLSNPMLLIIPGLRDLNSARLKITERYLLNCDEIFAICYIGRATTDAGVMGVFELARRANLSNIGIICTKSDVSAEASLWLPGSAAFVRSTRPVQLISYTGYSSG